jgi:polysaccharide biosynthesis protein PslG
MERRSLLKLPLAAMAGQLAADFKLPPLGRVKPRRSLEIAASPFSIGFELLDRRLFEPDRAYPMLAQLGVKWARTQTGWSRCETKKGEYDFSWLDKVVDSLRANGIQPWFNLGFGNKLYTPEALHETAVGFPPLNSQEAKAAWVRFAGRIAEHFRTRVQHWEIWNEPNIAGFWRPIAPSAESYMELVKMTAPLIRKRIPKAVIVGGGFSGLPLDFLEGCLELGLAKYADRVSFHPYRRVPEAGYDADVRTLRTLLAKYKPGLGIWQGENGVRSANAIYGLEWNEPNQARWITRRLVSDLRHEIELISIYHTVDCPGYFIWSKENSGWKMAAGVLHEDFTPKPSYHAYQCLCALFDAQTKKADLAIGVGSVAKGQEEVEIPAICTAAWLRNGHPLYAYWYPADFSRPFAPRQIGLSLWSDKSAPLAEPVLVDPIGSQIYRLEGGKRDRGSWKLNVPMVDYPLFVTDRSVVA